MRTYIVPERRLNMSKLRIISYIGLGLTAVGAIIAAIVSPGLGREDALEAAKKLAEENNK